MSVADLAVRFKSLKILYATGTSQQVREFKGPVMKAWIKQNGVAIIVIASIGYVCATQLAVVVADAAAPAIYNADRYTAMRGAAGDVDPARVLPNWGGSREKIFSPSFPSPKEIKSRSTDSTKCYGSFLEDSYHGYGREIGRAHV